MQQIKNSIYFFVLVLVLFLIGCNEPATTSEKKDMDTSATVANSDISSMPAYDPAMDPYNTGGGSIQKLHDTLGIKMYVFTVKPGDSWALHTHPDHTVYVLQGGKMALFIEALGKLDTLTFPTGMSLVSVPISDSGRNIGNTTIKFLVTDIYRPRSGDASSMPAYDPALEPLIVGAQFSKKLQDTLNIKMYEFTIKPGDSTALHAHPDHTVYVLQGGKGLFSLNGAAPQLMELKTGMGFISPALTDAGKNIGTTTVKLVVTDIYRPRGK